MHLKNVDFFKDRNSGLRRPYLPIRIFNPHTGKSIKLIALIDTGADEVTLPAYLADEVGHNLKLGVKKRGLGAGGKTTSFTHTTQLEIFDFEDQLVCQTGNIMVEYLIGLHVPLLGVRYFLEQFELSVHYPKKVFSLKRR